MITSPKLQHPFLSVLDIAESVGAAFTQAGGELCSVVNMTKQFAEMHLFFPFREITLKVSFLHPETENCTRGFAYSWHSWQRYQASILIYIIFKSKMPINIRAVLWGRIRIHMDPHGSTLKAHGPGSDLCGIYIYFVMQVFGAGNIGTGSVDLDSL
jgi:hypothetical protein